MGYKYVTIDINNVLKLYPILTIKLEYRTFVVPNIAFLAGFCCHSNSVFNKERSFNEFGKASHVI